MRVALLRKPHRSKSAHQILTTSKRKAVHPYRLTQYLFLLTEKISRIMYSEYSTEGHARNLAKSSQLLNFAKVVLDSSLRLQQRYPLANRRQRLSSSATALPVGEQTESVCGLLQRYYQLDKKAKRGVCDGRDRQIEGYVTRDAAVWTSGGDERQQGPGSTSQMGINLTDDCCGGATRREREEDSRGGRGGLYRQLRVLVI